jgi:hypothetical protein
MTNLRYPNALLLIAILLGVCADWLFYGRAPGLSVPLFVGLGLLGLWGLSKAEGFAPTRSSFWLGAAALAFAILSMIRAAPALVTLNIFATLSLLLLVVISHRGAGFWRLPGWQVTGNLALTIGEIAVRPLPLALRQTRQLPANMGQARALVPIGRGLLLALPVLFVFTGLLMSADSIFASYVSQIASLSLPFDVDTIIVHSVIIGLFAWTSAGGILAALRERVYDALPEKHEQHQRSGGTALRFLGWTEAMTVLVAVDLLFGGFMLVQGVYFFGGLDGLARSGLSYAEYARRGFFELLTVACLTLAMLWVLSIVSRREGTFQVRLFNLANGAMVALVLGMLASAFQRMWLYEQAYGFTQLRIYTHSFMVWLALVLLLFVIALLVARPQLFSYGSYGSALAYLAVLTIVNPDGLIVQANIARHLSDPDAPLTIERDSFAYSDEVDLYYLTQLSSDATPALVAALPLLGPEERAVLEEALRNQRQELEQLAQEDGWPGFHLARAQALGALDVLGPKHSP